MFPIWNVHSKNPQAYINTLPQKYQSREQLLPEEHGGLAQRSSRPQQVEPLGRGFFTRWETDKTLSKLPPPQCLQVRESRRVPTPSQISEMPPQDEQRYS